MGLAEAHPILQNPLWITVKPDLMQLKLYVSLRELNVVQGLPIALDGAVDLELAKETAPRHDGYVLDHLNFRADGVPLQGKVTARTAPGEVGKGMEGPDRAHYIYWIDYPLATPPARIAFSHTMVKEFPSAPGVEWDLSYAYRFGQPDVTPKDFGAISRGMEIVFETGFATAPGSVSASPNAVDHRPSLIRLALLGAVLGLGVASRGVLLRIAVVSGSAFLVGWGLGWGLGWRMPGFAAAALAGIGILLTAVDNIHRPSAGLHWRRWVLASYFPAVAGVAGAGSASGLSLPPATFAGLCLGALLGGCLAGAALALMSASKPAPEKALTPRPWLQLASLAVCLGGLVILFDGLGIRPWAYWVERLGS